MLVYQAIHKEYDDYKWTMPTSRFWQYINLVNRYYESQKPVDKRDAAINKAKALDWTDEIKAAKHGRR